ncbi:MAG: tyrosine-type recombinase/integrase [Methanotrichaceae archaeon]|nr:tyrosine-type recombinase/integrase [Methanotrichaceae archaeon]
MDWLKDPLVERYLEDCGIRGMSPRSFPGYHSALRSFLQYLDMKGVSITEVGQDELIDFIKHLRFERKVVQRTLQQTFSVLSSFYEYLVFAGQVKANPILPIRKRYLKQYKENGNGHERKLISIEDMARMINSTLDIRDKAIITLLAKTGIRWNELITLDLSDVDFVEQKIRLKPTAKRSNRTIFFDDETAFILHRWVKIREGRNLKELPALFLNAQSNRLERRGVSDVVTKAAVRVGLHDAASKRPEDHFSPHCCRHWFTTHLRRAGMPREFIQELRGDVRKEAIDIYDHIDKKELKESYLAHMPQLGI